MEEKQCIEKVKTNIRIEPSTLSVIFVLYMVKYILYIIKKFTSFVSLLEVRCDTQHPLKYNLKGFIW